MTDELTRAFRGTGVGGNSGGSLLGGFDSPGSMATGIAAALMRRGSAAVNQRLANRIAEMLEYDRLRTPGL